MIGHKKLGRPSKRPANEELEKMYNSHSIPELCKYYGVSHTTMHNWIKKARDEQMQEVK